MTAGVALRWWREGSAIDKLDTKISSRVFALMLGPLEWPLSLCCLVRMPLSMTVGPLFLAMLAGGPRPKLAFLLWLASAVGTVGVWIAFCSGKVRQTSKYLFSIEALSLSAPLGLLLARLAGEEAFAIAAFHPTAWFASMTPIILLKHKFGRRRPVVASGVPATGRMILTLVKIAQQDARNSFPSGDAPGAIAFALPLALGCGWPLLAVLIVLLACFASMYWKAHFALDLVVGAAIGLTVSLLLHASLCPIGGVKWWQPLVAEAIMISCAMLLRRLK